MNFDDGCLPMKTKKGIPQDKIAIASVSDDDMD
jgi:hypothetical protein